MQGQWTQDAKPGASRHYQLAAGRSSDEREGRGRARGRLRCADGPDGRPRSAIPARPLTGDRLRGFGGDSGSLLPRLRVAEKKARCHSSSFLVAHGCPFRLDPTAATFTSALHLRTLSLPLRAGFTSHPFTLNTRKIRAIHTPDIAQLPSLLTSRERLTEWPWLPRAQTSRRRRRRAVHSRRQPYRGQRSPRKSSRQVRLK
jgi:hypothetical protein